MNMPFVVLGTLVLLGCGGMAWTFTAGHRALNECAFGAMDDTHWKQDAAAAVVERSSSQLCSQKQGRAPFSLLSELLARGGSEYRIAFAKRLLAAEGQPVPDQNVQDMVRRIRAEVRSEIRTFLIRREVA